MRVSSPYVLWPIAIVCLSAACATVYWAHAQTSGRATLPANAWFNGLHWQHGVNVTAAPDFRLPDQNRKAISLHQLRGRVTFVSFTSSVCRQQCPLVGRALASVERRLGPLATRTALVNISVDPEADTPATVTHFARAMGWSRYDWYYLWASRARLQPVWQSYYVNVPTPSPILKPGKSVVHSATIVMVDQAGKVRAYMAWPFSPSGLVRGARALIESDG